MQVLRRAIERASKDFARGLAESEVIGMFLIRHMDRRAERDLGREKKGAVVVRT